MRIGLALPYARNRCHFLFHKLVFVVFLFIGFQHKKKEEKKNKKYGGEDADFYFFS
jgi:hypothetical protein